VLGGRFRGGEGGGASEREDLGVGCDLQVDGGTQYVTKVIPEELIFLKNSLNG